MEARAFGEPAMSADDVQAKKPYEAPRLVIHGTIQDLTGNPGGNSQDGFGGSAPII